MCFQAQAAGAEVVLQASPRHSMTFASAADFFDVFMLAGPMQARLRAFGPAHMAASKERFLQVSPKTTPFVVTPNATLLVMRCRAAHL